MTIEDLGSRLDHLDPGAVLVVERSVVADLFGGAELTAAILQRIEDFAVEHRCSFVVGEDRAEGASFEKDDVF
jgi:hypothetical protein